MKHRILKHTDIALSELSLGCMSLPLNQDGIEIIHRAIDNDICVIDTADLYDKGENEILVGKAIQGKRQEIVLSSKVGNVWNPDGNSWDWKPTKSYILEAINQTLKRLKTDYLDLYLLHGGTLDDPMDEIVEAFELLIQSGKIRSYGLSSIRPNTVRSYLEKGNFSAVMTQYSYLDRRGETNILPFVNEKEIPILARGVLAQGLLVNKPSRSYLDFNEGEVASRIEKIKSENESQALAFVLENQCISSAVLGIRTQEQLVSSLKMSRTLSAENYQELLLAFEPNSYQQHQ